MSIFVFITDFLLAVVRLLQEDLLWLRNYFQTLTIWNCVLFLLLLLVYKAVYTWLMRFGLSLLAFLAMLVRGKFVFAERTFLSSPVYRVAYKQGYIEGEQARIKLEEERRKQEEERRRREEEEREPKAKWYNPFTWFKGGR